MYTFDSVPIISFCHTQFSSKITCCAFKNRRIRFVYTRIHQRYFRMAILSIRIDDKLKESLSSEAQKEGISLSEYVKKSLEIKSVDTHILATEKNLKSSVDSIKDLALVSQETVHEVELNIQRLNESLKNANHLKEIKKLKWILISISLIFVSISIPIFHFNIAYFKTFFY
ncbi:hypothetical protein PNIG_a3369 [Pseudoalteromonas nigrifaciens]|uniref:Uncharacterized protein n=1 Tax=Pseudoalteromonas nigrifaciens TaxID=28109 RepID=A0AAC9UM25_9GAMM|nr:hypothetical protein PSM_B0345 [Pseudoalteromonas sp. SM9913]ASM55271.1 hypothetical protein PNIG_a3369 [Pseudoalteromonas nigrifaciens]ATD05108.1 hypothetical protein PTET_b0441 [Pseudoalteromonas tetraodonis]